MNISTFIRQHLQTILDEWECFARALPVAFPLSREALRDHAEGILLTIATDIEQDQTPAQEEQKSTGHAPDTVGKSQAQRHGSDRVLEGFSVNNAMAEYRALRASVLRLWKYDQTEAQGPAVAEVIRFNEAVDQALTESLASYASDKERRNRLYDTLLSASPDLNFIVDPEARLVYGNAALAEEFEQPISTLKGKRLSDIEGHIEQQFDQHIRRVASTKSTMLGEISRRRRGQLVTYEYLLMPVTNAAGVVEAVAGTARNITDRKASEERHKRNAQYDDLTGLPNRQLFWDRLNHAIKRASRIHLPLSLMFVDLDGFKQVNDLLGHAMGDELLRQAATRIRDCVRDTDTVARLGGDEFTVIVSEIRHMPHVNVLAQQILDELSREFSIAGHNVVVSASMGLALYPTDAVDARELLRHADHAMYAAKQSGRNRYCFFTAEMRNAAWLHQKRLAELRVAMPNQQLQICYQPIVDLASRRVVGAEAQLCWQHPDAGRLPAHDFIDLIEEAGLSSEIDQLILREVLEKAEEWRLLAGAPLHVSIEHASLALSSRLIEQQCEDIIVRLGRPEAPVALEVIESMLLSEAPGSTKLLQALSGSGVPLCIDDFGTGYSSLNSLTRFPLTGLRIAPHLVRTVMEKTGRSLVCGMIATAHALGLKVIAEGVQNEEQTMELLQIGVDYAQGAHFFGLVDSGAFRTVLAGPAARDDRTPPPD